MTKVLRAVLFIVPCMLIAALVMCDAADWIADWVTPGWQQIGLIATVLLLSSLIGVSISRSFAIRTHPN